MLVTLHMRQAPRRALVTHTMGSSTFSPCLDDVGGRYSHLVLPLKCRREAVAKDVKRLLLAIQGLPSSAHKENADGLG